MLVYRVCSIREISSIAEVKGFDNVGNFYDVNVMKNTFNYDKNTRYLHFYDRYQDILYSNTSKGRVICVYDIPSDILSCYRGVGYYLDFINFKNIVNVNEYAIPTNNICYDYLVSYDILSDDLDFEDLIYDCGKRLIFTNNS